MQNLMIVLAVYIYIYTYSSFLPFIDFYMILSIILGMSPQIIISNNTIATSDTPRSLTQDWLGHFCLTRSQLGTSHEKKKSLLPTMGITSTSDNVLILVKDSAQVKKNLLSRLLFISTCLLPLWFEWLDICAGILFTYVQVLIPYNWPVEDLGQELSIYTKLQTRLTQSYTLVFFLSHNDNDFCLSLSLPLVHMHHCSNGDCKIWHWEGYERYTNFCSKLEHFQMKIDNGEILHINFWCWLNWTGAFKGHVLNGCYLLLKSMTPFL